MLAPNRSPHFPLVLLAILARSAPADVLLPDERPARHAVTFVGVADHPGHRFVLAPPREVSAYLATEPRLIDEGVAIDLGGINRVARELRVYAIERSRVPAEAGGEELERLLADAAQPALCAPEAIVPIRSVDAGSEVTAFDERYRVQLDAGGLHVARVTELGAGPASGDGGAAGALRSGVAIASVSALALAAWWFALRRSRPSRAEAP